ncbi:NUMOD4 domain-containing protein [Anaerocolumna sp. MB42-C2]|uniref:NUMOD4 domain-containing protein n=1 Tax=Anaerocolumna sp. MB42-C2 TaxID=3070997 RepID=UPI0027E1A476|nr:NUMOD4 domain-containing protein [Anaerocolumna sp. MB42-C2]WMJ85474.1 NUMOD4 domain-containing protein [Anaerocolumna sp. MB42-C2]
MNEAEVDIWKDIQGYNGKYQVSFTGQIRRIYLNGKSKLMTPFKKSGKGNKLYVHLTDNQGKDHMILVSQIVAIHFIGKPKPGQVPYHKNGCLTDNWASNLEYIGRKQLGKMTGASSRRQPVVKINSEGEIVECYSSARECARNNYMSYQTVIDRCNLLYVKRSIFAPDGYAYAWEDDEKKLNAVLRRIELETQDTDQEEISRLKQEKMRFAFEF